MRSEHRLHPYSIVFGFLTQIRAFIVPALLLLVGASSQGSDWEALTLLFVIPSGGFAFIRYFTYRYVYETNELVIREGLIFRKERHIPYARIQNVDAVQNVLHRLLGVVEVRLHTGAGATPDATMSVLPASALDAMRRRVFADRAADAEGVDARDRAAPPPLLRLSTRELLICGFIENRGAVLIATGFGFLWEIGVVDRALGAIVGERMSGRGLIRDLMRSAISSTVVSLERVAIAILALIGLLLVIRVLSMIWAFVRLYGFTTRLEDEDLRSEYGLFTRVTATIPLQRIQAVTIRESPLHRLFARVAVSADTAGGGAVGETGRRDRELLAPLLRREALSAFVARVLHGIDIDAVPWQPVSPRAVRREIKGWLVMAGFVLLVAVAVAGRWGFVLAPALLAWAIVGARQTIRHLQWARTAEAIFFRRGWLWRRLSVARVTKIQAVTRMASPFDRRTGMARVRVDTAGATEADRIDVPYLPVAVAGHLHAELARGASETTFKW